MKQILPNLKELNKHLNFLKKTVTKCGFRHSVIYIDGLIAINKKTVKKISEASVANFHQSSLNRILNDAKFDKEKLEEKYLKKIIFLTKNHSITLIMDDSLVERNGKKIEETQTHKDHTSNSFITGHQFFTAIIYTAVIQLPLFPKLYSKNTDSKIEMASKMIDDLTKKMKIETILVDSWYSEKNIIKKCIHKKIRLICGIKCNRNVSKKRGEWESLSKLKTKNKELKTIKIENCDYSVGEHIVKLNGIPFVKLIESYERNSKTKKYGNVFYLISTIKSDTALEILQKYKIRWIIETYHRDIKQNLGFDKLFLRKKEGIVRHSILSSLAYAVLQMFMFSRKISITIGQCCEYIQNIEMNEYVKEIVEIEDKKERLKIFNEVFIRETAKV